MLFDNNNHRESIINKIIEQINKKLPTEKAKLVAEFVRQYYATAAITDLEERTIDDLYGAILSHWELISKRKPGECKIRIYNPHYEQHMWQSTHTIVEVATDDMPFLVDSLLMELDRLGYTIHLTIHFGGLKILRNKEGEALEVLPFNTPVGDGVYAEAPIYIEIDRQTKLEVLEEIKHHLEKVLHDVRCAVDDWSKMRDKLREALGEIEKTQLPMDPEEVAETKDFLRWLENDHFTFLGYREYVVAGEGGDRALRIVPQSGLGVLREVDPHKKYRTFASLSPEALRIALSLHYLIISKTNTRSSVHRPVYTDYIGIKRFNENGELIGERRFIGLYTSTAYHSNPKYIPFVRHKVAMIMKESHLSPTGHAGKALLNILETLPRDDLFQASAEELAELSMGILHLQERKRIRLFARRDVYGRFISCLVFVPRDRFTSELAQAMQDILKTDFHALEISFNTRFSDSALARIHYVIRLDPSVTLNYNPKEIEAKLIEVGRSWKDEFKENLLEYYGEERGNVLYEKYRNAFPAGYRELFTSRAAIYDVEHIESLSEERPLTMGFYRPLEAESLFRFKLFRPNEFIPLSDALPIFENMGLRVIGERPYEITFKDDSRAWINDFSMTYSQDISFEIEEIKDIFQDAFFHIWNSDAENDGFNRLVLKAKLSWHQITILRAYTKYLKQTEFTYSQSYIEECFNKHPQLAAMLVQLFYFRFDPQQTKREEEIKKLEAKITEELDKIIILDEDRIIRRFSEIINATLRTNYFQVGTNNKLKTSLSIKLDPKLVPEIPLPLPMFEIFVYSPRFEGVHLRSSKVARGGLRWSDRREDFRTEILGLMKAQNVKNAVIVPSGAKGGFVIKSNLLSGTREDVMEEVINCYKSFIRGMLDITDNLEGGAVVHPQNVVFYDDEDPYLVVAADKGTATFSDIANHVAEEYGFWLEDGFASGGSMGYDHKKMAITARGAWESVKRHFRELGRDIQQEDFTVVGVGDMSGDVFGNGMLLSRHIKLVAAFNHQHIFLDPNPDVEVSFRERERLFNLPRSSWEDYDRNLISTGGGVFKRTAKAIKLTPEVKELLGLKKDFIVPNELMRELLKSKVDLLWNGGIGTFVKATNELNINVGDRANDLLRVNGEELQCLVVGEGGNLGFTQLGRIEYALKGGRIYTDFIDNSAGVDCSDHEVNIKILLHDIVANGDMTLKQRNILLGQMRDQVSELVLYNNYHQTEAISLAASTAEEDVDLHNRYIQEIVRENNINLKLEGLPTSEQLLERKALGRGLSTPEMSVLFAYCKIITKKEILNSDVPEDPYFSTTLQQAFPTQIRQAYKVQLESHRLRREIIATLLSNTLVNEMGFTFLHQLQNETGAPVSSIVRAYTITRNIFGLQNIWAEIEKLDYKISAAIQLEMLGKLARLIRRATRWFLRNRRMNLDIVNACTHFTPSITLLREKLSDLLVSSVKENYLNTKQEYIDEGATEEIGAYIAAERAMISALDIIEAANVYGFNLEEVAITYFTLGESLELGWFREQINEHAVDNEWEALAKEACRDDLDWQQRGLAIAVLQGGMTAKNIDEKIDTWLSKNQPLIERWHEMIANLRANNAPNFVMYSVAVRELMDLTQTSFYGANPITKKNEKSTKKHKNNNIKTIIQTDS